MTRRFATAPLYIKSVVVDARPAEPGEVVRTVLRDGTVETTRRAAAGDIVITNPDGEQYAIAAETFAARYEPAGDGRWRATDACRALVNPTGEPIIVLAPWGEQQHGGPDAMLAVAVDPATPDAIGADRYIIGAREFAATYQPA